MWEELQKRKRRRKKQLHQILTSLSDSRVAERDVNGPADDSAGDEQASAVYVLGRPDYDPVSVRGTCRK